MNNDSMIKRESTQPQTRSTDSFAHLIFHFDVRIRFFLPKMKQKQKKHEKVTIYSNIIERHSNGFMITMAMV